MFFNKQEPNLYTGDISDEAEVLEWLTELCQNEEIEDVTDEMLDELIKSGKPVVAFICK